MTARALVAVLLLAGASRVAGAQAMRAADTPHLPHLRQGTPLRVHLPPGRPPYVAALARADADSIVLVVDSNGERVAFARATAPAIDFSTDGPPRERNVSVGMLVGLAAGAFVGHLEAGATADSDRCGGNCKALADSRATGAFVGAAVGAAIGMAVGYGLPHRSWSRLSQTAVAP